MRRLSTVLAAGAALITAPAAGLLAPAASAASAGPPVVAATIYTGSQAGIASQTVTVGALGNCPTYAGASPFLLDPGSIPYQPPPGSSWSLDSIVECGLGIPAASLTDVAVQSVQHGFELPLTPADLTDPSHYQDPTAPGALPVISLDGNQNQVTYARPERSPGDANAGDRVVDSGPVTIAVYENAAPLRVHASFHRLSVSSTALHARFAATVTDAAGRVLAPTGLSWSWSFGDGAGSARATPTHSFPLGRWPVTVVVGDRANGTGGTATIPVSVDSHALTAPADRSGAGNHRTGSSPSGVVTPTRPTSRHGGTLRAPTHHRPSSAPSGTSAAGQSTTTSTATTPATTPRATTSPATTLPATTPPPAASPTTTTTAAATTRPAAHGRPDARRRPTPSRRPRQRRVTRARSAPGGRIVSGLLIADVTPLAPALGRPAQVAPAAAFAPASVRFATRSAAGLTGLLAAALVLALLTLGAARELRGRRRWRELRAGS